MNKTGLKAKISTKYVLPTCIWKYFWRISRYFAEIPEFRGSATARNIRSPAKATPLEQPGKKDLEFNQIYLSDFT